MNRLFDKLDNLDTKLDDKADKIEKKVDDLCNRVTAIEVSNTVISNIAKSKSERREKIFFGVVSAFTVIVSIIEVVRSGIIG